MATAQWWISGWTAAGTTAVIRPIQGGVEGTAIAPVNRAQMWVPVSAAGTITAIRVDLSVAPGAGKSRTYTVYINGSASTIAVTISGTDITGTVTGTEALVAGDLVTVEQTTAGTPATSAVQVSVAFVPTTLDNFTYPAHSNYNSGPSQITPGAVPYYEPLLFGSDTLETAEAVGHTHDLAPFAGEITAFYVKQQTVSGASKSYTYVVTINGIEQTASELTISGGAATTASVSGLHLTVNGGDTLTFKAKSQSGTPNDTRVMWATTFVPADVGRFAIGGHSAANPSQASATYFAPFGVIHHNAGSEASDVNDWIPTFSPAALDVVSFYLSLATAPGAGKSWAFASRKNLGAGSLAVSVSESATTGNDLSPADSLTTGDTLDWRCTPSGTPANQGGIEFAMGLAPTSGTAYDPSTGWTWGQQGTTQPAMPTVAVLAY